MYTAGTLGEKYTQTAVEIPSQDEDGLEHWPVGDTYKTILFIYYNLCLILLYVVNVSF